MIGNGLGDCHKVALGPFAHRPQHAALIRRVIQPKPELPCRRVIGAKLNSASSTRPAKRAVVESLVERD